MIDAASRLLWRQGLHATGLNEILKESRAPRGSLYFHFPGGKEELATEAVVLAGNGITKGLAEIFDRHASLDEALADFADLFASVMEHSHYSLGCPLATVTLEVAATTETLRAACEAIYTDWERLIADKAEASGWDAASAASVATLILSAIEGALLLSRARHNTAPLHSVTDQLIRLVRTTDPTGR